MYSEKRILNVTLEGHKAGRQAGFIFFPPVEQSTQMCVHFSRGPSHPRHNWCCCGYHIICIISKISGKSNTYKIKQKLCGTANSS